MRWNWGQGNRLNLQLVKWYSFVNCYWQNCCNIQDIQLEKQLGNL